LPGPNWKGVLQELSLSLEGGKVPDGLPRERSAQLSYRIPYGPIELNYDSLTVGQRDQEAGRVEHVAEQLRIVLGSGLGPIPEGGHP
jgi:hypothetical protein